MRRSRDAADAVFVRLIVTLHKILAMRLALFCLVLSATRAGAQAADTALIVQRPDGSRAALSSAQLNTLPRQQGQATEHARKLTYDGVDLRAVLRLGGLGQTDSLRGPLLRRVVTVVGADGYRVAFALSELDPSLGARRAVLVDRQDGVALASPVGPRRLIVEQDARPSRWVRGVVRLEVSDLP